VWGGGRGEENKKPNKNLVEKDFGGGGGETTELKEVNKKHKYFQHDYLVRKGRKKIKSLLFTGHRIQPSESPV